MADETVPSWDTNFPAKAQAAAVQSVNESTVEPNLPAPSSKPIAQTPGNNQRTPPPATGTPDTGQVSSAPTTPDDETPLSYEDALKQQVNPDDAPLSYENALKQQAEAPRPSDIDPLPADNSALKKHIEENLQVYNANLSPAQPEQHPANSIVEAIKAGFGISDLGLLVHGKMPEYVLPENGPMAYRIANQIAQLAGDMPAMVAGGIFGGIAAGAEGATVGSVLPGVGTAIGGVTLGAVGAGAGSFAAPAALRKMLIDHYTKGDMQTSSEFVERAMATLWEATKGGVTGGLTALTGGAASVAGPIAKIGAELATMTTVGAGLEGHLPNAQEILDGAIIIGGLHAASGYVPSVAEKVKNIFAATGDKPIDIVQAANRDVILKQDLNVADPTVPKQALETEIKDLPMGPKSEEGKEQEVLRNQLVPVPEEPIGPKEIPVPKEERSPEVQEILDKIGHEKKPEPKTFSEMWNDWYAKSVDWTDPLKVAYAAFKAQTGKTLSTGEQPQVLARLFAGHVDFLRRVLEEGVSDEEGNFSGEGINKIYESIPADKQADFDAYSLAKRAKELFSQGKKPWKDFNPENNDKVIKQGADQFEDAHRARVDFLNSVLDYGVRKGVLDPKLVEASKANNKEYIPFNRIMGIDDLTEQSNGSNGKLLNKIEGSDLELKNPRAAIQDNIERLIKRAQINDIRLKTLENFSYVDTEGERTNDFVRETDFTGAKNQIAIWRDGKISALEGTPGVIDSLRRLEGDAASADVITKIAKGFSNAVRIGTTSDPGFAFRHFFRSTIMSGVYSKTGQIPFYHPLLALSEFMGKSSDAYKNWLSDGGAVSTLDGLDGSYVANGLEESDSKYPFLNSAWNLVKKPFEASEAFIKMTDNLVRFTEYKRTLEQGGDRTTAAFNAREVTPDFAKVGLQRSALRTSVAFIGAHINSMDRMAQAFKEDPQGTLLKMSVLSGISAMTWLANKDDKDIEDLPDYQKDLYWNFKVSDMFGLGSHMVLKFPKPWAPGILFGSGVERSLDAYFKNDPHAFDGFEKSIYDSVVPNITPTVLAPVFDQLSNRQNFTGRPLVDTEQQKLLPEMQYHPYTSETAKQLAKIIQAVPKVRDIGLNETPLASPEVVENYIRGWTSTLGGWALKISDAGLRLAGVTPKNVGPDSVEWTAADYPILNEFFTRFPSARTEGMNRFYDNYDKTQKIMNSIKDAQKLGDFGTASRILYDNQTMSANLGPVAKTLAAGKKAINNIQQNPTIPPIEKRQTIDSILFQINSAAKMANQQMDEFQKQIEAAKTKGSK